MEYQDDFSHRQPPVKEGNLAKFAKVSSVVLTVLLTITMAVLTGLMYNRLNSILELITPILHTVNGIHVYYNTTDISHTWNCVKKILNGMCAL